MADVVQIVLRMSFNWFQNGADPSWTRPVHFSRETLEIQSAIIQIVKDQFSFHLDRICVVPSRYKNDHLIMRGVDTGDWGGSDNFVRGIADFCQDDFSGLVNERYAVHVEMAPGFTVQTDVRFKMISCKTYQKGEEPSNTLRNFGMFYFKDVFFSGFEDAELKTELEIYGANITDEITNRTDAIIVEDIGEVTNDTTLAARNGIIIFGRKELNFFVLDDSR